MKMSSVIHTERKLEAGTINLERGNTWQVGQSLLSGTCTISSVPH